MAKQKITHDKTAKLTIDYNRINFAEALGLKEASLYLGLSSTVVYRLARQGAISSTRVGDKWVFRKTWLNDFLEKHKDKEVRLPKPKKTETKD